MILYKHKLFDFDVNLENRLISLTIENPVVYRNFYQSINSCKSNEENIIFSDKSDLSFEKFFEIILNPFEIDLNTKKLLEKTYENVSKEIIDKEFERFKLLSNEIINFINDNELIFESDIEWKDEITPSDIFSILRVQYTKEEDYLSYFTKYIKLTSIIMKKKFFICNDIESFLAFNEINKIKTELYNNEITLISISNNKPKYSSLYDVKYVIDFDKCSY